MLKHFKTLGQLRGFWVCFKESYATLYKHKAFSRYALYLPNIRERLKVAQAVELQVKWGKKKKTNTLQLAEHLYV